MKNKIKKWHIALMSFMALFVAVFASMFSLRADTVDEETGEILMDNWELSTVFYDSSVDGGKTPLTEINWDASDGSYKAGTPRVITVQINYKNNSAVTTYQPGELEIIVPHLSYGTEFSTGTNAINDDKAGWITNVTIGANDLSHIEYDWNLTNSSTENLIFTNVETIEENANFEGSIQIIYEITPAAESNIEKYEDECTHKHSKILNAVLKYNKVNDSGTEAEINITSNDLMFDYIRTYIHPWDYMSYSIEKTASKISSWDGLGNNPEDYIWVKYKFKVRRHSANYEKYPLIGVSNIVIKDVFPEQCVVFDTNSTQLIPRNNTYEIAIPNFTATSSGYEDKNSYIYVGYPKSIYNENASNLTITNYAELWGQYNNKTESEKLSSDQVSLNLADFVFEYEGDLYSITKSVRYDAQHYSQFMLDPDFNYHSGYDNEVTNDFTWKLDTIAIYTGNPMTIHIGDDLLYITDSNKQYRKLNDDEYYLYQLVLPTLYNGNGNKISYDKYTINLYVRYAGDTQYTLYQNISSLKENTYLKFTQDQKIVGFYYEYIDLEESLKINSYYYDDVKYTIKPKGNISQTGSVYNFDFMKVFFKDEQNNLILQNTQELDSYANFITKEEIANYDLNVHGTYIQRATAKLSYSSYNFTSPKVNISSEKSMNNVVQNEKEEIFTGTSTIKSVIKGTEKIHGAYTNAIYLQKVYGEYSDKINCIDKIYMYDLLPEGMELLSTKEEITNNILVENWGTLYASDGTRAFSSYEECIDYFKKHASILIEENWNNTNRTKITVEINCNDRSIIIFYSEYSCRIYTSYKYSISYDSLLQYGTVWTNYVYSEGYYKDNTKLDISSGSTSDNGKYDSSASDINEDGNITDYISYAKASKTITSVISTHQDVTTYVKTDQSNYSTGIVDSSCDSEYEYKLRVRTGAADVTNLVIYTSIEEAQPKRTRWYGEFLGIDTSYAENKGYTVKVWYSPNKTVGTLTEDTSWQVYDEATVDKSKVKSLAFQYLVETDDTTGTSADTIDPAVLPANSLTYVLIKMKSPNDESETRLARMDCWTQWNAIDEFDQPVDFITGINSNVVKVALPNSVKTDDLPSISLKFIKEIQGETTDFENLKLNKADEHIFMIRLTSLTANDDGTYNQVTGLLSSTQGLVITQIPIGTYLLEELGDNYFDFVEFTNNNDPEIVIEGVTFEKTDQGYIITVSEDLAETIEFNIKVTNKTEDKRFYEDKEYKENLFLKNKIVEDPV